MGAFLGRQFDGKRPSAQYEVHPAAGSAAAFAPPSVLYQTMVMVKPDK